MSSSMMQNFCDDLLYLIFHHTLPLHITRDGSEPSINITAIEPMNFYTVCRTWKAVVDAHPNLWGLIVIRVEGGQISPLHISLLSNWLRRSRSSPLEITYTLLTDEKGVLTKNCVDTISRHFSHLGLFCLFLYDPGGTPGQAFTFPFSPSFVELGVYIHFNSNFTASLDFTICSASTRLKYLRLVGQVQCILPKSPTRTLRFPNLRLLSLSTDVSDNPDDFYTVLSACPNVNLLKVYGQSSCTQRTPSTKITLLPHTTRLVIIGLDRLAIALFFNRVTCPSLLDIEIHRGSGHDAYDPETELESLNALQKFFTLSQPPLERMDITFSGCPPCHLQLRQASILRDILRPLPDLDVLFWCFAIVDDQFFEQMTIRDHGPGDGIETALCPMLRDIVILSSPDMTLSLNVDIIDEMIASRLRHGARRVALTPPGGFHRTCYSDL